jgi:hypothetical protein
MAFADTGTRTIVHAALPVQITLAAGVTVNTGDPLGNSSGWKLADANNSIYMELIAGEHGEGGDVIVAYRMAVVEGFSGGTDGANLYLSDTAGKYSDSAGSVSQVCGQMVSATRAVLMPHPIDTISRKRMVRSKQIDLDFGATTDDEVILRLPYAVTLVAARIVYEGATTGTVAGGSVTLGTTVGGTQIATAVAFENSKAVGAITAVPMQATALAANTPLYARWTGVASTQAGLAHLEVDYIINDLD